MLKYHNIENIKLPLSEEIFFQPSSYNEYTGFNKYPIYAWWSAFGNITSFINLRQDDSDLSITTAENFIGDFIYPEIDDYLEMKVIRYRILESMSLEEEKDHILIGQKKYGDVEFLIKFEWDDGDRSVGINSGYEVSLVLNNNQPIYRSFEYECE